MVATAGVQCRCDVPCRPVPANRSGDKICHPVNRADLYGFFVFESLTRRPLHPMQYLLVGLSLVLFYTVLLALSEHIGFTAAGWRPACLAR